MLQSAAQSSLKLLLISTPVGALGSGLGGGVELTLQNLAEAMWQRGYQVQVLAPAGSRLTGAAAQIPVIPVDGTLQPTAQTQGRESPILLPKDAVLAAMWDQARQMEPEFDLLLNFAYDWLPFYLSGFLQRPVAHLVSMGSLTDAMDQIIEQTLDRFPKTIGVHSRAQAETFSFGDRCRPLGNGLDLSLYQPVYEVAAEPYLAWVGRIAPEKGIEDAIAAAQASGLLLKIWGAMPDQSYWQAICQRFPEGGFRYQGFRSTQQLQQGLRQARALVMTPKWIEAFGNVAIEALACGVPVLAYQRGGPAEIVESGKTGWLVEPDSVDELVAAIGKLDQIDRRICRQQAEARFSMQAMGERVEAWFAEILASEADG
ncbi:MAG: glycosyltransferase family 4 protein [Pegethrix bostrychoides GSE-TBD4-15B]|uniref:Glycosyltransferase family 4 protein n=1 Tax=Pegethrix bostrychoides GSE-TBD4-15B TaxID=2839662 RepID=A0A951PCJ1_9CYAN|nr:glycosyltransferase family 4 protein [Pegethrix bostrychoides GSE-TBD4-15B]